MTASARFWDRHAAGYAKRPVPDQAVYERKLAITRELFRPDSQVLEIGCGTGTTAILHAPHVGHIRAIDISPRMLEIARGKARDAAIDNVDFEQAVIDDFRAPEESYDVVLGLSILHLLEDKETVIARVHEWLKPGGAFVTSTACLGDGMKWFKWVGPIGHCLGLIPMVKVFTAEDLARSLTDAGFAIEHQWRPGPGKGVFIVARKAA